MSLLLDNSNAAAEASLLRDQQGNDNDGDDDGSDEGSDNRYVGVSSDAYVDGLFPPSRRLESARCCIQ